jgi:hypothetical protein
MACVVEIDAHSDIFPSLRVLRSRSDQATAL